MTFLEEMSFQGNFPNSGKMKAPSFLYLSAFFVLSACSTQRAGRIPYDLPDNVILELQDLSADTLRRRSTVILKATDVYRAGAIKRFLQGKNYREAWEAPVEVPIVWLDTLRGGLKIQEEGGGGQTRSLDFVDAQGQVLALRSVCKDLTKFVPKFLKKTGLGNPIMDAISADHPYAALPSAALAEAAGVIHTQPKIYFVPCQPALDTFNDRFGNRLFWLEFEPEGKNEDWVEGIRAKALLETEDVEKRLAESTAHRANQQMLLRARLLDFIIGDWDRHGGNWGWAAYSKAGTTRYAPIAADRDNAFFKIGGVLPWLINRSFINPKFKSFQKKIRYLPGMLVNSKTFDPVFLNRMTRQDYLSAAQNLQNRLTDRAIENAIHAFPDTIFKLDGARIIENVKARRNDLIQYALEFYRILAKRPEIHGTRQADRFILHCAENGILRVQVFSKAVGGEEALHFERAYFPNETKSVTLYGWGGGDTVEMEQGKPKKIKVYFQGEQGKAKNIKQGNQEIGFVLVNAD